MYFVLKWQLCKKLMRDHDLGSLGGLFLRVILIDYDLIKALLQFNDNIGLDFKIKSRHLVSSSQHIRYRI